MRWIKNVILRRKECNTVTVLPKIAACCIAALPKAVKVLTDFSSLQNQTEYNSIKTQCVVIDDSDQMLVKETKRDAFKNSLGTGHSEETGQQGTKWFSDLIAV